MRWLFVALGWLLAAAIGMSHLARDAYFRAEVVFGFALGFLVIGYFLSLRQPAARPHFRSTVLVACLVLPTLIAWRAHAPKQDLLDLLSVRLAGIKTSPTREDLHSGHVSRQSLQHV